MDTVGAVNTILSVALASLIIYAYVVALLRFTGNRTLSSLRAFDFLVTVAMGTVVGTAAVQGNADSVLSAVVAVTVLVVLQVLVAWLSARFEPATRLLTNQPRIVLYDGTYLEDEMRKARVTKEEVELKIRGQGVASIDDTWAVVLEANGEMSVLTRSASVSHNGDRTALRNVNVPDRD